MIDVDVRMFKETHRVEGITFQKHVLATEIIIINMMNIYKLQLKWKEKP